MGVSHEQMIVEVLDDQDWACFSKMVRKSPNANSFLWATKCPGPLSICFFVFLWIKERTEKADGPPFFFDSKKQQRKQMDQETGHFMA